MAESLTIDFGKPLPLFPLPACVLLPHVTVPLHVFEPRYRKMVHDTLAASNLIAMAMFEGQEWKADYQGSPALRPGVCVGYVVRHEKLTDGRYNILLQGVCRASIVKELPHAQYRMALLRPTETDPPMEIDMTDCRREIEDLLADKLLGQLAAVAAIHQWLSAEIPTAALVDLAVMAVTNDVEGRYRMLVENDASARCQWLLEELRGMRQTLALAQRYGAPESPDGVVLN